MCFHLPTKSASATRYFAGKERTVKNGTISSRASIVQRSKGQSAVEQSAYINRTSLYSDYYGMTYNRTAKEDLVGAGVLLPEHAPPEFADRAVLWNSVEKNEKAKNAQLARSLKYSLPNEWDEATARQVMERFIKEQFVNKGMCADYGIHRSYNDKGQPNLHIHILLTLRPLNEDGTWGAKSRKEYVLDADGNRIPNASGKGYKSRKVNVIDWNEKGKAKEWRNAIAEIINATNEKAGIAERVDPRSYKDRGIPLIPTIHLGERASALERKGIRTERGNINRAIEKYNAMIMKIYGFISELKEELKKGVFKFVFERKSRTERDDIQSINPSINPSVPEQKSEVQLFLQSLDHFLVLLVLQDNRLRIGNGKAAAELKAALVLRYDMEMQVRIAVAERTEVDLGAAPQLLNSAGSSSQICTVIVALLLVALAQLLLMALERQCAAALVCLILEQVQGTCLHVANLKHDCFAALMVLITVKTAHCYDLLHV